MALALRGFAGLGDLLDGPFRTSTEGGGRGMPGKCGVADGVARLGSASKKQALAGAFDGHE